MLITIKSWYFGNDERDFIEKEIENMLQQSIIEPSSSWIAKVIVMMGPTKRKRLCLGYSQTINQFTKLDAYPCP